ncbi:hypothetical protein PhaeoP14_01939 [Phaeobacter piscinae]|nr:hypothetical protein PhaeoP14_01939 [Phaeobacter piscinae]
MPILIFGVSGVLLAASGYHSPYSIGLDTSCETQLLTTTRLLALCVGSIGISLTVVYLGYGSYNLIFILFFLTATLYWLGNNEIDLGDLRDAANLNSDECVRLGLALVIGFCGAVVLVLNLGRAAIRKKKHLE